MGSVKSVKNDRPACFFHRSLSKQEGEPQRKRPRPRLESLSDLIYGLSLSIGAISLVITNGQASNQSEISQNILEFIFVFLILITSWIIYTSDMSVIPVETRLVTFLNVVLLIFVAIMPYMFDQIVSSRNEPPVQDYASILFTIDYAGSLLIMPAFAHIIAQEEMKLVDREIMIRFRQAWNILAFLALIVSLSLAALWDRAPAGVHVRLLIWYLPIFMFWFNRLRRPSFVYTSSAHHAELASSMGIC